MNNRPVGVEDLYTAFSPEDGVSPGDFLANMLAVLQRIEHLMALDLVMRHGTTEQAERARQHLLDELAKQERDG